MKKVSDELMVIASQFLDEISKQKVIGMVLLVPIEDHRPRSLVLVSNISGTPAEKSQYLRTWANYLDQAEMENKIVDVPPMRVN